MKIFALLLALGIVYANNDDVVNDSPPKLYAGRPDSNKLDDLGLFIKRRAKALGIPEMLDYKSLMNVGCVYARTPGFLGVFILHKLPGISKDAYEASLRAELCSCGIDATKPLSRNTDDSTPLVEEQIMRAALPLWEEKRDLQDTKKVKAKASSMLCKLIEDEKNGGHEQNNPEALEKVEFLNAQLIIAASLKKAYESPPATPKSN